MEITAFAPPAEAHARVAYALTEVRKYLMRQTSSVTVDTVTGRSIRNPGWLERFTYY